MTAGGVLAAVALAVACCGVAEARSISFDPPRHPDARDAGGAPLDVRRVAFGQRELRMVLEVRTAGRWSPRGERRVCLLLRSHGRLCVVRGGYLRFTPVRGEPRVIPAAVSRRDGRSLRASFSPHALGLRLGRVAWALETRPGDRVPDSGWFAASVRVLGHPRCFGAAARDFRHPCRNPALRRVVFPRPVDAFLWTNSACRPLRPGPRIFDPCEFGVTGGGQRSTFLVIGDSHAMHWRPALTVVAEAERWRGVSVARPGCPFSAQIPRTPSLGPGACARLQRQALAWLRAHPQVETLFVSNWAPPGSSPIGGNAAYGGGSAAYGAMLDRVPPSVKRIYVLRDIPHTTIRAVNCVKARRSRCSTPRSAALVPDPGAAAARSRGPRVRAVDLTRFFCGATQCFPVVGGAFVYKDYDHMNAVFGMSLGPYVLRALRN